MINGRLSGDSKIKGCIGEQERASWGPDNRQHNLGGGSGQNISVDCLSSSLGKTWEVKNGDAF